VADTLLEPYQRTPPSDQAFQELKDGRGRELLLSLWRKQNRRLVSKCCYSLFRGIVVKLIHVCWGVVLLFSSQARRLERAIEREQRQLRHATMRQALEDMERGDDEEVDDDEEFEGVGNEEAGGDGDD
jgi:hypothetical protein